MKPFILWLCELIRHTFLVGFFFQATSLLFIWPITVAQAGLPDIALGNQPGGWQIEADQIHYDQNQAILMATGNVTIKKSNKQMHADKVVFDNHNRVVDAFGHVVFTSGKDILTGQRLSLDLDAEIGTIYEGLAFISENHFYIKGDTIRKIGRNTYDAKNASISTCDAESPDWIIKGREVQVTVDGYGRVKNASLWARGIPLFYTPYFSFPAKVNRQTGFLSPYPAYSDRKGIEYIQPFYWAINDSSDVTFVYHHMQERGEKLGLEYRYVLCPAIKGMVMVDGFHDRQVNVVENGVSLDEWGYLDEGTDLGRPNEGRYWIRAKQDLALPYQIHAQLDIDVISDQDYLHEFKNEYGGFEYSDQAFLDFFGRDLDDYDDTTRINRLNLNKTTSNFSINSEIRWYDNVLSRLPDQIDTSRHKLPAIRVESLKRKMPYLPFFYTIDTDYTQFYRSDRVEGETYRKGQRVDLYGRIYWPWGLGNYLALEPSYGFRQTNWFDTEVDQEGSISENQRFSRHIYDVELDLFSELTRVFNYSGQNVDRVKHAVRPEIVYQYIPQVDQENLPDFDLADSIPSQNQVTYALTNTWTVRSKKKQGVAQVADANANAEDWKPGYRYNRLCRLKVEQSYDFLKRKEDPAHPFSDISFEFDIFPLRYLWIDSDAKWSPYDGHFTAHNIGLGLWDGQGNTLKVEHRYSREVSQSIYTKLELGLTPRLETYIEYERNIKDQMDILLGTGVNYNRQCWGIGLHYLKDEDDWRGYATISLMGISGFTTPGVHLD